MRTNDIPVPAPADSRGLEISAFLARHGWERAARRPLSGDASFRRYERLTDGARAAVLMDAPPDKETVAPFLQVARLLTGAGFSAPEILAEDAAAGLLLLEDLGDDLFSRVLKREPERETALYLAAAETLLALRRLGYVPGLPAYDEDLLMREAMLFADWYLPAALGREKAATLREEFSGLWRGLLRALPALPPVAVLRDFHADNLLWLPGREGVRRVGLLDFQDAVMGSPAYDLVSFLEDARRELSSATHKAVMEFYARESGLDAEALLTACALLAAQRNSKIIGIFMRLALRDGKRHYPAMIPFVWRLLERDIAHPALRPLRRWLDAHVPPPLRGAPPQTGAA